MLNLPRVNLCLEAISTTLPLDAPKPAAPVIILHAFAYVVHFHNSVTLWCSLIYDPLDAFCHPSLFFMDFEPSNHQPTLATPRCFHVYILKSCITQIHILNTTRILTNSSQSIKIHRLILITTICPFFMEYV